MSERENRKRTMSNLTVHSLYWNNIDPRILEGQRQVFEFLEIPLKQHNCDRMDHGIWMDSLLENARDDEGIIICDIDAFPIKRIVYEQCIDAIARGHIFGMAQTANHSIDPFTPYAGPMFIGIPKSSWVKCGSPSLSATTEYDAAQLLSVSAGVKHVNVELINPSFCLQPKWAFGKTSVFGTGTFYGNLDFFHLFVSREKNNIDLFSNITKDIIDEKFPRFENYLEHIKKKSKASKTARFFREKMRIIKKNLIHNQKFRAK